MRKSEYVLILIFVISVILGCSVPVSQDTAAGYIEGIVVNYQIMKEDNAHLYVVLEFEDGRVIKLRSNYSDDLLFKKNTRNKITYSTGQIIERVEYEMEKTMQLK